MCPNKMFVLCLVLLLLSATRGQTSKSENLRPPPRFGKRVSPETWDVTITPDWFGHKLPGYYAPKDWSNSIRCALLAKQYMKKHRQNGKELQ